MQETFAVYEKALQFWEQAALENPQRTRIPRALLEDTSERAQKQVARMNRNYAFDRARYFLPAAAPTNVMMIMSARGWVNLCQHLLSHPLEEARALGNLLSQELALAAPRLLKHATEKPSIQSGLREEFSSWQHLAQTEYSSPAGEHQSAAFLEVFGAPRACDFARDLSHHDNRYAYIGEGLKRTMVRFGWDAVALAEIRDLNRHRTGTKYCPLVPRGFYGAQDQWTEGASEILDECCKLGQQLNRRAFELLQNGEDAFVYWTLLGTQYPFEHNTTADKFLYEAELRTGTGAHYRYARHLHDALALWFEKYPDTRGLVLEGSGEPE